MVCSENGEFTSFKKISLCKDDFEIEDILFNNITNDSTTKTLIFAKEKRISEFKLIKAQFDLSRAIIFANLLSRNYTNIQIYNSVNEEIKYEKLSFRIIEKCLEIFNQNNDLNISLNLIRIVEKYEIFATQVKNVPHNKWNQFNWVYTTYREPVILDIDLIEAPIRNLISPEDWLILPLHKCEDIVQLKLKYDGKII